MFDYAPTRVPRLVVLGDSHALAVGYAAKHELGWRVDLCPVYGATAQGLHNPNSKTDALRIFRDRCSQARDGQWLAFQLGEVDCGFVIWYRAEKYDVSIASQLERSISAYTSLIREQVERCLRTVVLSAPFPTILDGQDWGEVANARREVKASLRDRTSLTVEYNDRLARECERVGATFLDVSTPTLDPDTGLIADEFRCPNPTNHHLHPARYPEVIAAALRTVGG